jgi:mycoredoxin
MWTHHSVAFKDPKYADPTRQTMSDLYILNPTQIVMYSVAWCPDCRRARTFFEKHNIPYLEVDVDHDPQAATFVKDLNRGFRSVPTIIFPDGSVLTEPSIKELDAALT